MKKETNMPLKQNSDSNPTTLSSKLKVKTISHLSPEIVVSDSDDEKSSITDTYNQNIPIITAKRSHGERNEKKSRNSRPDGHKVKKETNMPLKQNSDSNPTTLSSKLKVKTISHLSPEIAVSESDDEKSSITDTYNQNIPIITAKRPLNGPIKVQSIDTSKDSRKLSHEFRSGSNFLEVGQERGTYNQGRFTTAERNAIDQSAKSYLKANLIPENDLIHLINRRQTNVVIPLGMPTDNPYSSDQFKGFFKDIQSGAAINRSLDQVYWYMSRAYNSNKSIKRTNFTEEEDERICEYYRTLGPKWAKIDSFVGRPDCRLR
jgi:hypothetical protein